MKKHLIPLLYLLCIKSDAYAASWLCAGQDLAIREITSIYSGERMMSNGKWITAFMLPSKEHITQDMFNSIGLSPIAVEKRAQPNSLVEIGIKVRPNTESLLSDMIVMQPSVGYSDGFKIGNIRECY